MSRRAPRSHVSLRMRLTLVGEHLRAALWALPAVSLLVAVAAGLVLPGVRPVPGRLGQFLTVGGADGARQLLSTIAASVITVAGVVFSITVVTLQLAATQYSPRVLRNFLRDRGTQLVFATFLATFTYSVVVLRAVPADSGAATPRLAVTVAVVLAIASVAALVFFIHHVAQSVRVESIMQGIERVTVDAIDAAFPEPEPPDGAEVPPLPEPPESAGTVTAAASGYLQAFQPQPLVRLAAEQGLVVRLRPHVGHHVVAGAPIAWLWPAAGSGEEVAAERFEDDVNAAVEIGFERTLQQDVAFGLRQLVDIALRANSPSVNDPTTAVEALNHIAVVLVRLATRDLPAHRYHDEAGHLRLVVTRPSFPDYLDLACDQIRRYGAGDGAVAHRLFSMLGDVGARVHSEARRGAVAEQIQRVLDAVERADLQQVDVDRLRATGEHALAALGGALHREAE